MKLKDKPIILFILLFLGMELFSYVFFALFSINFGTKNEIIRIIVDLIYMLIIYFFVYQKEINQESKDYIKNFKTIFITSLIYYIAGLFLMHTSSYLIGYFVPEATAGNEEGVRSLIDNYPIYMFFSVVIYAPFVEEIVFRKSVFNIFKKINNEKIRKTVSVLVSGFIFALLHVIGSANTYYDYLYVLPYLSLGLSFALIYCKTNNILSTIVMHSLHNLVALILYIGVGNVL